MEKIDAKVVMFALLPVLLLQYSSFVGAVDIIFFLLPDGCTGAGFGFFPTAPNSCYTAQEGYGGSILFSNAGSDVLSYAFGRGGCSTDVAGPGTGTGCYTGGGYTGATWFNSTRRSLLSHPTTHDPKMEPNSVIFTDYSANGHWILTTSNVDHLYSEMLTVPNAEKANWLKSRGAVFDHL